MQTARDGQKFVFEKTAQLHSPKTTSDHDRHSLSLSLEGGNWNIYLVK